MITSIRLFVPLVKKKKQKNDSAFSTITFKASFGALVIEFRPRIESVVAADGVYIYQT